MPDFSSIALLFCDCRIAIGQSNETAKFDWIWYFDLEILPWTRIAALATGCFWHFGLWLYVLTRLQAVNNKKLSYRQQGHSQGGGVLGVLGPPNPIPLKLLRIKRVRSRHSLSIRLIELWMFRMNWELRSINCYELVGYFGLQLARLCRNLVLWWRHLYRVPRTVTRVANRHVYPGTSRISGPVSRVPAWVFPGRKMSRIFVKPRSNFLDAMRHQFTLNSIEKL